MCISITTPLSQASGTVKVGAIFTFSTINGKVSKIAMEAAENDINADPTILGGWKLSLIMHDSNFSGFLDFIGALHFMEIDTVAIIGPQSSVMARVLSQITKELQTPLLSFTALDPTISPLQYPYFIQTAPNDLFMVTAIADVVRYYQWPEVIAIYNDEDQGRNGMNMLDDMLLEKGSKLSYKAAIPVDVTRSEVQALLTKFLSMESCVVIVYTYTPSGLLVFDVARSLGMVREGYVWIATTWLSNVLDSGSLDAQNLSPFQGALTFRPHTPYSKRKKDFIMRWDHLSNGTVGLNPCGFYAYDTVWMIAHAVRLFLDQGNTISFSDHSKLNDLSRGTLNLKALSKFDGGEILRNNILKTNMNGLTGPIRFNPDRSVWHPSYDVINVVKGGSQLIGYWSNYSGLSVVTPETLYENPPNRSSSSQNLSTVVWPGGGKVVPRGWVFPHNGMPFRIGVPNRVSYRDIVAIGNGTSAVQGYCIDIFLAARRLLPYELPYEFVPFGDGQRNPNYYDLVNEIATGVFDAVVGDVSIVRDRTKIVDFTQPFTESGLVVVAPVRKLKSSVWAFLRPFTLSMWGITVLFFVIVGSVVWLLEHKTNDEFRGPPKQQFVTVLCYTASLTSILTVEQLSSPITGIESLIAGNVAIGYQVGSFAENYLRDELNIAQSRLVPLGSPVEYARALSKGTVAAVVDEKRYVDIFLADHCKFSIQGLEFTKRGWGFAFRKDSPIAVDMSTAILRLSENGELQRLENKWLSRKPHCQVLNESSDQLELENFLGLFLVCGIACLLALTIYFCYTVHQFNNQQSPVEGGVDKFQGSGDGGGVGGSSSPCKSRGRCGMRRIRRFMSYADGKTDAWKMKLKRKRGEDDDDAGL
ncbi:Glutamate receptor 3.2 [Linum grandiflorum]